MKRREGRVQRRALILPVVAIALLAFLTAAYQGGLWLEEQFKKPETRGNPQQRYDDGRLIEIDGITYRERSNVTKVLLMGVDRDSDAPIRGYRSGGQADFLRLMVIDHAARSMTQIQIDRDTMTPITILGVLGDKSGERTAQISLSHGFGDGRNQSGELTRDAVSNLLLGMTIDCYMAMNLDGIAALNDWAGGVTVTLEEDFSAADPAMKMGATLTLTGSQAEAFVRGRRGIGEGTNAARMERQQQYISLLTGQMESRLARSREDIGELYDVLEPYLSTDMSRGRMINEVWNAKDYARSGLVELAGEHRLGSDGFVQFWADEDALQKTVLDMCYEKIDKR